MFGLLYLLNEDNVPYLAETPEQIESTVHLLNDRERRTVGFTVVQGVVEVSTVFLVLSHPDIMGFLNSLLSGETPKAFLFETMVTAYVPNPEDGGLTKIPQSNIVKRYSTWFEAEVGHESIVQSLQASFSSTVN
jgi:hypothetical protein